MSDSDPASELQKLLAELQKLLTQLKQGIERIDAIQELPVVDSADGTWDAFQCLVELARIKSTAERIAGSVQGHLDRLEESGIPTRTSSDQQKVYSLKQLVDIIGRMVNPPGSRRRLTYIPPFDIEKTLRAFLKLREEAKGHLRILDDLEESA